MSLKQFLVVGRSFAESPREKSPFEMRKDVRLPTFENAPRFAARPAIAVQTDWLEERKTTASPPREFSEAPKISGRTMRPHKKRRWLRILSFGLFGKETKSSLLVQEEMQLEKVRVIRNDLADADLEVVVNKRKKFALRKVKVPTQAEQPAPPGPPKTAPVKKREEWSELTARLFEIGQH